LRRSLWINDAGLSVAGHAGGVRAFSGKVDAGIPSENATTIQERAMCNDYGNHVPYSRYVEAFSELRLPLFVQGNGPDLTPRDDIHIRDTAPVILRTPEGVELTQRIWAPRASNKKPVFNFRSEGRRFGNSIRCLIPTSHFFEFAPAADPKQKRKAKWRFSPAASDWLCIAGIVRPDALDGSPCFTMLTTPPGPDVAPIHDRQVAVLAREDWQAWLDLSKPESQLLRPLAAGSLEARREPTP
jgi:putative SOS response-associated peptidase YedK